jgi:hypothetical protein
MVEAAENRIGDNVPEPCRKRRIYGDCGNAVARQWRRKSALSIQPSIHIVC